MINHILCRLIGLSCLAWCVLQCLASETLPAATEVTRRMVERAQQIAGQSQQYAYDKKTLIEELDSQGGVVKSTVKVHRVKLIAGLPFSRLVQIQGRELSEEELKKENRREEEFRQKTTSIDMKKMAERKEAWLTPQLIDKFEFVMRDRKVFNGRPALLLDFTPKSGNMNTKTIQDKILSQMAGSVWVDEAEAETAKFSVGLQKPVSIGWLGMLGSLSQCNLEVERIRTPDGVWINGNQRMHLSGRKLFSPLRLRITEESSGFSKE